MHYLDNHGFPKRRYRALERQRAMLRDNSASEIGGGIVDGELHRLGELWERARTRHLPITFGCTCGMPIGHVSAADFELDLLDFLEAHHGLSAMGAVIFSCIGGRTVASLLAILAGHSQHPELVRPIIADLVRSIESFAAARPVGQEGPARPIKPQRPNEPPSF